MRCGLNSNFFCSASVVVVAAGTVVVSVLSLEAAVVVAVVLPDVLSVLLMLMSVLLLQPARRNAAVRMMHVIFLPAIYILLIFVLGIISEGKTYFEVTVRQIGQALFAEMI